MWTIEPKRETIVKYSVTITLDLDEINKILVDPSDFQRQLRVIRNSFEPKRKNFASDGQAHGSPPNKKHSKKKRAGAQKATLPEMPQGLHAISETPSALPRQPRSIRLAKFGSFCGHRIA